MVSSYRPTGRSTNPNYQEVVQAYRALRAQYDQLAVREQQQAQRVAQLERALLQANQDRASATGQLPGTDPQVAELAAQLERQQAAADSLRVVAERAEQQVAKLEQDYRAALERTRQSEEKLAAAEDRLATLQVPQEEPGDAAEWRERYLRQQADAENFRRRQERRFAQQASEERRDLLRDMLPLADNLELGLQHLAQDAAGDDARLQSYAGSLRAVRQAFLDTLERYGVRPVAALGQPFDPTLHEALGHLASSDVPEGYIAHVVQNGYRDSDGLVRPARVLVSSGPPAAAAENSQKDQER